MAEQDTTLTGEKPAKWDFNPSPLRMGATVEFVATSEQRDYGLSPRVWP